MLTLNETLKRRTLFTQLFFCTFTPFQNIMSMSEDDPRRMEAIRKYAAIYGRFDCKRKPEKPLTLHEVSVCVRLVTFLW